LVWVLLDVVQIYALLCAKLGREPQQLGWPLFYALPSSTFQVYVILFSYHGVLLGGDAHQENGVHERHS
jgi:hypothetical protein